MMLMKSKALADSTEQNDKDPPCDTIEIVGEGQRQEWAQPEQRHHFEAFFSNGLVNSFELGIVFCNL